MSWDKLSMADKAKYIQLGVSNGITDINTIKQVYNNRNIQSNKFGEGGPTEQKKQVKVLSDGSVLRRDSKGRLYRDYSHEPWYEDWMGISASKYKSHPEWIERDRTRIQQNRAKTEQQVAKIERRNKTNEEKANKIKSVITNIQDNPTIIDRDFAQGVPQAIENQKQQTKDKVQEYKKAVGATLTALELGLGAYSLGELIRPMQSLSLYSPSIRKAVATASPVLDAAQIFTDPYDIQNYMELPFSTIGAIGEWDLLRGTRYGNIADKIFDITKYINASVDVMHPVQLLLTEE